MGCCFSATHHSDNPESNSHHFHTYDIAHLTILEEEAVVKEVVLSESPKYPKSQVPDYTPLMKCHVPSSPDSSIDRRLCEKDEAISEIELSFSGVSDFFSFSAVDGELSVSTPMTMTMRREKNDEDEDEVVGPPPPVYAARKKSLSGEFSGASSRTRWSPEKRSRLVSPARGIEGRAPAVAARRRRISPGTGTSGAEERRVMKKSITTKTGASGCGSIEASAVKCRRVVKEPCDVVSGALVETFENPLVSLECFIFL